MADYNRNQRGYRNSNQDWNDDRYRNGRNDDDDRYGSENRNYGNSYRGYNGGYDEGNAGWQSRYERENFNRGDSNRNRQYDDDFDSGNYSGSQGYSRSSNYGSGSSYGQGNNRRGQRNLYDNDYEGMYRRGYSNMGTRVGGANYGGSEWNRNYNDGSDNWRRNRNRDYDEDYYSRGEGTWEDRNWMDRTKDEVSSWFGNEEAEHRRERDRQMRGQHRGKGPRNYSRSDDRIKDDVNDRLSDDSYVDASDIDVSVSNGEVTLTGTVEDRSSKRRAEDLAESVSGVKNVENRIRVTKSTHDSPKKHETNGAKETSKSTSAVAGSERNRNKNYVSG